MRRLCRLQRIECRGATGCDLPGRGLQDRVLGIGRRPPLRQLAHPAARIFGALCPVGAFRRDAGSALAASRMFAGQRVTLGPCLAIRHPGGGQRRACGLDRSAQRVQVGQCAPRIASQRQCAVCIVALDGQVLDPSIDCGEPRSDLRCPGTKLLVRCSHTLQVLFGARTTGTGFLLGGHRRLVGGGGGGARLIRGRGFFARCAQVALQQRQPVALLQPDGGRGRRAGPDRVAVPAPDGAVA
jgi:hypothetical protein